MQPSTPQLPTDRQAPVPPHRPLTRYYGEDAERERYVADLFNKTAKHYNTVEKLFGNGGLLYRRLSLRRAGLQRGMKVLDVAMGTAAVGRGAAKIVGPEGLVVGVDPSQGMLAEAAKVFHGPRVRGYGQALPIRSEYFRVLKPGGRVWILEGHVPRSALGQRVTRFVWARLIPGMTLIATGSREAKELMDYYWDTVDKAVSPETIVKVLEEVGFANARAQVTMPGAFVEYSGRKPA